MARINSLVNFSQERGGIKKKGCDLMLGGRQHASNVFFQDQSLRREIKGL